MMEPDKAAGLASFLSGINLFDISLELIGNTLGLGGKKNSIIVIKALILFFTSFQF